MVNETSRRVHNINSQRTLHSLFLYGLLVLCTSYALDAQSADSIGAAAGTPASAPVVASSPTDSLKPKVCFTLNLSPQLNLYSASFDALPGVPNCCTQFTNTNGLGFSLAAGIESVRDQRLFGQTMRYGLAARFSQMGANFVEDNVDANVIIGNTAVKGISEHRINVTLSGLLAEPYIAWKFFTPALQLVSGVQIGTYLGASYAQKETLISPSAAVFETGTTVRNEQSGALPNKQSLYFGASIGFRYALMVKDNLEFLPELRYNYGLSPVISNLDWKANALQAGLTLRYTIVPHKEEPPPPPPPPVRPPRKPTIGPKPPIVHIPREVHLDWVVSFGGQPVQQDAKYVIEQPGRILAQRDMPVDKLFFEKNSEESLRNDDNLVNTVVQLLKADSSLRVELESSSSVSEDKTVAEKRAELYRKRLIAAGIADSRIQTHLRQAAAQKYPELDEEQQMLQFRVLKNARPQSIIRQRRDTVVVDDPNAPTILIRSKVKSDIKTFAPMVTTSINGDEIQSVLDTVKIIGLNPTTLRSQQEQHVSLKARVMDEEGNKDTIPELRFSVQPRLRVDSLVENIISDSSARCMEFVIGYCEFDKVPLYSVDEAVLPRIREYAQRGRAIEVIAMTDNLGSEAHNEQLANARSREAIRLLNLPRGSKIRTRLVPGGLYGNDSAMGRTQNRGVVVRISLK